MVSVPLSNNSGSTTNLSTPGQVHENSIPHWRQVRILIQNFDVIAFPVDHHTLLGNRMSNLFRRHRSDIQRDLERWLVEVPPRSVMQPDQQRICQVRSHIDHLRGKVGESRRGGSLVWVMSRNLDVTEGELTSPSGRSVNPEGGV